MMISTSKDMARLQRHLAMEATIKAGMFIHTGVSEPMPTDLIHAARGCLMDALDALSRYEHELKEIEAFGGEWK